MTPLLSPRRFLLGAMLGLIGWNFFGHSVSGQTGDATSSAKHSSLSTQVKIAQAKDAFDTGRYDLADKRYRAVLGADPDNKSAQWGLACIGINHAVSGAERAARPDDAALNAPTPHQKPDTSAITRKLQSIVIPNIEFRQTTLNDAVEFLRQEARRLDTESPEEERGVNIFLKPASGSTPAATDAATPGLPTGTESGAAMTNAPVTASPNTNTRISLTLVRIPMLVALDYIAKAANLKIKIEPYAVSIVPYPDYYEGLVTQEFRVSPSFFGPEPLSSASTNEMVGCSEPQGDSSAKEFLEASGVTFPPGTSAVYLRQTGKLVVRDTQANLELVEALVAEAAGYPQPTPTP